MTQEVQFSIDSPLCETDLDKILNYSKNQLSANVSITPKDVNSNRVDVGVLSGVVGAVCAVISLFLQLRSLNSLKIKPEKVGTLAKKINIELGLPEITCLPPQDETSLVEIEINDEYYCISCVHSNNVVKITVSNDV